MITSRLKSLTGLSEFAICKKCKLLFSSSSCSAKTLAICREITEMLFRKQFRHLSLCKPDSLVFDPNLDVEFPALRLIHDNLVLLGCRQSLFFVHFSLLPPPTCLKKRSKKTILYSFEHHKYKFTSDLCQYPKRKSFSSRF